MPQPVKLSDSLVEAARGAADDADRSLAGQIEHWARLGRSVEGALAVRDVAAVKRAGNRLEREFPDLQSREKLLQTLRLSFSAAGHSHLGAALHRADGTSRYGTDPAFPGFLVRVDADGRRTPGRFVNRRFVPLEAENERGARR